MQFTNIATLLGLALAAQAMPAVVVVTKTAVAAPVVVTAAAAPVVVYETVYVTAGSDNNASPKASTTQAAATTSAKAIGHTAAPATSATSAAAVVSSAPATTSSSTSAAASTTAAASTGDDWILTMLCRINKVRAQHGVQPLGLSTELNSIAQSHSQYMSSISDMTHSDPSGSLGKRLSAAGTSWSASAENIASGMSSATTAQTALENSPSHFANMVGANLAYFGAGSYNGYYTQDFYALPGNARPANVPSCN